jgi:hypothetical protein
LVAAWTTAGLLLGAAIVNVVSVNLDVHVPSLNKIGQR